VVMISLPRAGHMPHRGDPRILYHGDASYCVCTTRRLLEPDGCRSPPACSGQIMNCWRGGNGRMLVMSRCLRRSFFDVVQSCPAASMSPTAERDDPLRIGHCGTASIVSAGMGVVNQRTAGSGRVRPIDTASAAESRPKRTRHGYRMTWRPAARPVPKYPVPPFAARCRLRPSDRGLSLWHPGAGCEVIEYCHPIRTRSSYIP